MQEIEIYSSKKKAVFFLMGSLAFVSLGFFFFLNAENFVSYKGGNLMLTKVIGILTILFFGVGIFISIKRLIKRQLILVINKQGIKARENEIIKWENIVGFSELKIHSQRMLIINVNNPEYHIENELNPIMKRLMEFNLSNYGSPFNLSAHTMQINYKTLLTILNKNLEQSKQAD